MSNVKFNPNFPDCSTDIRKISEKQPVLEINNKLRKVTVLKALHCIAKAIYMPIYQFGKAVLLIIVLALTLIGSIFSRRAQKELKLSFYRAVDALNDIPLSFVSNIILIPKLFIGACAPKKIYRIATAEEADILRSYQNAEKTMTKYYALIRDPVARDLINKGKLDQLTPEQADIADFARNPTKFEAINNRYETLMNY